VCHIVARLDREKVVVFYKHSRHQGVQR